MIVQTVKKTNTVKKAYRSCFVITNNAKLSASNIGMGSAAHGGLQLKPKNTADKPNSNWNMSSWYSPIKYWPSVFCLPKNQIVAYPNIVPRDSNNVANDADIIPSWPLIMYDKRAHAGTKYLCWIEIQERNDIVIGTAAPRSVRPLSMGEVPDFSSEFNELRHRSSMTPFEANR